MTLFRRQVTSSSPPCLTHDSHWFHVQVIHLLHQPLHLCLKSLKQHCGMCGMTCPCLESGSGPLSFYAPLAPELTSQTPEMRIQKNGDEDKLGSNVRRHVKNDIEQVGIALATGTSWPGGIQEHNPTYVPSLS